MKKLIIDKGIFYQKAALLNNDIIEFIDYKIDDTLSIGDIYLAKIKSINNSNTSAFVELGEGQDAYLANKTQDIKQGDLILVEVSKEAFGTKLPSVTVDISIAGKNIVLLPMGKGLRYSRKIKDKENIKALILELENAIKIGGAVLRSGANFNDKEEIIKELDSLKEEYESYKTIAKLSNKPKLIKRAKEAYEEILIDKREAYEIIVNDKSLYKSLEKSNRIIKSDKLILKETNLFSIYGISEEKILAARYEINGAELVIENTEAMTVIDVNSKGKQIDINRETNILKINLSLCPKLVQLIILKNISGIIIVDFISMKEKTSKETLINMLKEEFKIDKNPVKIMEITSLGLVQIVRQRQGIPLLEKLTKTCSYCNGTGYEANNKLAKIRLEEKIQLLGYDIATQNINKINEILDKDEIEILEKTYKTPV